MYKNGTFCALIIYLLSFLNWFIRPNGFFWGGTLGFSACMTSPFPISNSYISFSKYALLLSFSTLYSIRVAKTEILVLVVFQNWGELFSTFPCSVLYWLLVYHISISYMICISYIYNSRQFWGMFLL